MWHPNDGFGWGTAFCTSARSRDVLRPRHLMVMSRAMLRATFPVRSWKSSANSLSAMIEAFFFGVVVAVTRLSLLWVLRLNSRNVMYSCLFRLFKRAMDSSANRRRVWKKPVGTWPYVLADNEDNSGPVYTYPGHPDIRLRIGLSFTRTRVKCTLSGALRYAIRSDFFCSAAWCNPLRSRKSVPPPASRPLRTRVGRCGEQNGGSLTHFMQHAGRSFLGFLSLW